MKGNSSVENHFFHHVKWEVLKFKSFFLAIKFSKQPAQRQEKERYERENKLEILEENSACEEILQEYKSF